MRHNSQFRFYLIEIRKCQFEILSEYSNIREDNDECKHQCLTQCHINSGKSYSIDNI